MLTQGSIAFDSIQPPTNTMASIQEILRQQRMLISERQTLGILGIRNTRANREWLATVLPFELAMLPRQTRLYRYKDIKPVGGALRQLASQLPPQ